MKEYGKSNLIYRWRERKVPKFSLPNLLVADDGRKIENKTDWEHIRREEILQKFREYEYGFSPSPPSNVFFETEELDEMALEGRAIRKQARISLTGEQSGPFMHLLLYLPKNPTKAAIGQKGKWPIFVGLNFYGNHTIHPDPNIILTESWSPNNLIFHVLNNKATAASRGVRVHRWPIDYILDHGYGLANVYYGDIVPDRKDGLEFGLPSAYAKKKILKPSQNSWGAISAWAWGLSRAMDYFEKEPLIDPQKVAVIGHSRLGKTSLWAGAQDPRFSIVISNCSGCGGAAISRREFGETVYLINRQFPHWFCANFKDFNQKEPELPIDQHMLISLIAPRPCYIASASRDLWADPKGEYLSGVKADPVYRLYGYQGLPPNEWPSIESPICGQIGHHIRRGSHDLTLYDWQQYIKFADFHYLNSKP